MAGYAKSVLAGCACSYDLKFFSTTVSKFSQSYPQAHVAHTCFQPAMPQCYSLPSANQSWQGVSQGFPQGFALSGSYIPQNAHRSLLFHLSQLFLDQEIGSLILEPLLM